jgi:hypothetical protein
MLKKSLQQILFEGKFQISLARFKKQSNSIDLSHQANSLMLNPSGLRPPLNSRLTRIGRGITRRLQFVRALIGLPGRLASWLVSRRIQRSKINQFRYGTRKKLVIFLIPGIQRVVGGMLQVFSLHRLPESSSRVLKSTHSYAGFLERAGLIIDTTDSTTM